MKDYYTYDHTDGCLDESATIYYGEIPDNAVELSDPGDAWLKIKDPDLIKDGEFWDSESKITIPVTARQPGNHPGLPGYWWVNPAVTVYAQ